MFGWRPASTILGVRMQEEQSRVGNVLSSCDMRPPMLGERSTRYTWKPASAMSSAAWIPAIPPPITRAAGFDDHCVTICRSVISPHLPLSIHCLEGDQRQRLGQITTGRVLEGRLHLFADGAEDRPTWMSDGQAEVHIPQLTHEALMWFMRVMWKSSVSPSMRTAPFRVRSRSDNARARDRKRPCGTGRSCNSRSGRQSCSYGSGCRWRTDPPIPPLESSALPDGRQLLLAAPRDAAAIIRSFDDRWRPGSHRRPVCRPRLKLNMPPAHPPSQRDTHARVRAKQVQVRYRHGPGPAGRTSGRRCAAQAVEAADASPARLPTGSPPGSSLHLS